MCRLEPTRGETVLFQQMIGRTSLGASVWSSLMCVTCSFHQPSFVRLSFRAVEVHHLTICSFPLDLQKNPFRGYP